MLIPSHRRHRVEAQSVARRAKLQRKMCQGSASFLRERRFTDRRARPAGSDDSDYLGCQLEIVLVIERSFLVELDLFGEASQDARELGALRGFSVAESHQRTFFLVHRNDAE